MNHPGKTSSQCGDELQLLELEDGHPVPVPVCSECIGLAHYREDTTNNTLKKALFKSQNPDLRCIYLRDCFYNKLLRLATVLKFRSKDYVRLF